MSGNNKTSPIPGDYPIKGENADKLGRAIPAKSFAKHVLKLDVSNGVVVGVFAPWGSGKTSFINIACEEFKYANIPVIEFNPWLFSGAEQLVLRFFKELSSTMVEHNKMHEIGRALRRYGKEIGSSVGASIGIVAIINGYPAFAKIANALSKLCGVWLTGPKSVFILRKKVEQVLVDRDKPIIVVLDDIDRLTAIEVREVFKLVRLTASFPNLIYIVSCDRHRVEYALAEPEISGRDYLDKIIQLPYDLPKLPTELLKKQLNDEIQVALSSIDDYGTLDSNLWPDVFNNIIWPLVRNMRDVRRYTAAIQESIAGFKGQVQVAELLGLEAVRLFLPDVFSRLPFAIDILTETSEPNSSVNLSNGQNQIKTDSKEENEEIRGKLVDELLTAAKSEKSVVHAMFNHLFPAVYGSSIESQSHYDANSIRKRTETDSVSIEQNLRHYLERVSTEELKDFGDAETAISLLTKTQDLENFIRKLPPSRQLNVILSLKYYSGGFHFGQMVPGIIALLNLLVKLPDKASISFNDARNAVRVITSLLLETYDNQRKGDDAFPDTVSKIIGQLEFCSSQLELIELIGHRQQFSHKLVSQQVASDLEKKLREKIRSASVYDLISEPNLAELLIFVKLTKDDTEKPFEVPGSTLLTFVVLQSAQTEFAQTTLNFSAENAAADQYRKNLLQIYGDVTILVARISSLVQDFDNLEIEIKNLGYRSSNSRQLIKAANELKLVLLNDYATQRN